MARPGQARATAARQDVAAIMQALKLGLELVFDIRQALRARRAEAVRLRQRAALLELLVQTMAELHISMAGSAYVRCARGAPAFAGNKCPIGSAPSDLISRSTMLERTCVTPGRLKSTSCRKRS